MRTLSKHCERCRAIVCIKSEQELVKPAEHPWRIAVMEPEVLSRNFSGYQSVRVSDKGRQWSEDLKGQQLILSVDLGLTVVWIDQTL